MVKSGIETAEKGGELLTNLPCASLGSYSLPKQRFFSRPSSVEDEAKGFEICGCSIAGDLPDCEAFLNGIDRTLMQLRPHLEHRWESAIGPK